MDAMEMEEMARKAFVGMALAAVIIWSGVFLKTICFALLGSILCTLGGVLLFKAWRPPNFDLATNMHIPVDVLILISAILIWVGEFLIFSAPLGFS